MTDVFTGREVVVTGGTGALGSAVVSNLIERGANVHVPVFHARELEAFEHTDDVHCVPDIDLSDEACTQRFYAGLPSLWASIHIAGGFAMAPLAETSAADFERLFRLNVLTCFNACRAAVGKIREASGEGRLLNVAAKPALVPVGGMVAYGATKAAVANLTVALAEELAPEGILVNAIVPSIIDTPANRQAMPDAEHSTWPAVSEIAETISFLTSPENAVTRGALVPVYGRS